MATIVQAVFDSDVSSVASFPIGFVSTPTSGNLVVLVYGARDADNTQCPSFTVSTPSSGTWSSMDDGVYDLDVDLRADMEYHTFGAKYLTSDGNSIGSITITPNQNVNSWWAGLIEINESGVSDWTLEVVVADGSATSNVSSIASGSTGTLSANAKVAIGLGASRTATENLTVNDGFSSLSSEDLLAEVDAGSANWIAAWKSLSATTALNMTATESSGASRMASAVMVFAENAGGTNATATPTVVTADGSVLSPTVTATTNATATPTTVGATGEVPAATAAGNVAVTAVVVTADGSVPAPSVTAGTNATATPAVVTAAGEIDTAAGSSSSTMLPSIVTADGSVPAPTIATETVVSPTVVTGAGEVPAPSVSTSGDATVMASVVTADGTVESAAVTSSASVTASVVTADGDVQAVTVTAGTGATITATVVTADADLPAASVGGNTNIAASVVTADGEVLAVTVTSSASVTVSVVTADGTVGTVSIVAGAVASDTRYAARYREKAFAPTYRG